MIVGRLYPLLLIWMVLTACMPESPVPQRIATYPRDPGGDWVLPAQPAGGHLLYEAYLALEVPDPEAASVEATRLTREFGGYPIHSYTSRVRGEESTTLELHIPPHNFEPARHSFRSLGNVVRETITGEWGGNQSGRESYARITLFLRRERPLFLPWTWVDWHPGVTLRRALGVSARLLGTLADALIWVVVLLGPIASIAWGISWVLRRRWGSRIRSGASGQERPPSDLVEDGITQGGNPDE